MQFQLPESLQVELLAYDPTLKKLARTTNSKTKSTKPKFPLGQPYGFVPEDAIKQSLVQDAIDLINAEPVKQRHHEFRRITGIGPDAKSSTIGYIYHYESCWYAAWLPPKGKEDDYVYGFAFAYKDNASSKKMITYEINTTENTRVVQCGRSNFVMYSRVVTKQHIINGYDKKKYTLGSLSWHKGAEICRLVQRFEDALGENIPTWNDSCNGIFDRIKHTSFAEILEITNYIDKEHRDTWEPSVYNLSVLILRRADCYSWGTYKSIQHIIDKPFFRKWIQAKCDEVILRLSDKDNCSKKIVQHPWNQIKELLSSIQYVHRIWPDCPIDYYQTHVDNLLAIYNLQWTFRDKHVSNWLNKYMPVASFFKIVIKHLEESKGSHKTYGVSVLSNTTGLTQYYFHDWSDTLQMLDKVLCARMEKGGEELMPPKRWRLTEFHDYVQAEAWKVAHANHKLPQDLFPAPIKVTQDHKDWTFIQPIDTHQLAAWGQAVRNCVGDASSYAEGVRKKKHFIVLAMLDNKPTFTIQLQVDMGMLSVKQIVGMSNTRLTGEQQDSYTKAFAQALTLQESRLQSA
jgi:hypothetical protein